MRLCLSQVYLADDLGQLRHDGVAVAARPVLHAKGTVRIAANALPPALRLSAAATADRCASPSPRPIFGSVIDIAEWVFLAIFTCELLTKVLAYGFLMHEDSYLRDAWCVPPKRPCQTRRAALRSARFCDTRFLTKRLAARRLPSIPRHRV